MREFRYKRGDAYGVTVMLHPDGFMTYRDVKCPHPAASKEYIDVVYKMNSHACAAVEKLLKEETNDSNLRSKV